MAKPHTLTITFAGVCTHLHDVIPGVPLRTVLPKAMDVHVGTIWIPGEKEKYEKRLYYLMPHVPWIRMRAVASGGHMLSSQYMRVLNAVGGYTSNEREKFFWLPEYAPEMALSDEVAYEGNAAAYFDTCNGEVTVIGSGNDARMTRIRMQTDGVPVLQMLPLPNAGRDAVSRELPIHSGELFITNLDFDPATEFANYDFLMNYLVAKQGIPTELAKRTPGMLPDTHSATMQKFGARLKALGEAVATLGTVHGYLENGGKIKGKENERLVPLPEPFPLEPDFSWPIQDPVPFDQSCSPGAFP